MAALPWKNLVHQAVERALARRLRLRRGIVAVRAALLFVAHVALFLQRLQHPEHGGVGQRVGQPLAHLAFPSVEDEAAPVLARDGTRIRPTRAPGRFISDQNRETTMLEMTTEPRRAAMLDEEDEDVAVIPLPPVVDTPAVVLLAMLVGGVRPVVLDASAVREVHDAAAPLLDSLLRSLVEAGATARVTGAGAALRRRWRGHARADWLAAGPWRGDDALFVCPDRDEPGFAPSLR
jgi:hypothetical protein